jgi:hypothetical protein
LVPLQLVKIELELSLIFGIDSRARTFLKSEPELDSQVYLSVELQMRFMKKKIEQKIKTVGVTTG